MRFTIIYKLLNIFISSEYEIYKKK